MKKMKHRMRFWMILSAAAFFIGGLALLFPLRRLLAQVSSVTNQYGVTVWTVPLGGGWTLTYGTAPVLSQSKIDSQQALCGGVSFSIPNGCGPVPSAPCPSGESYTCESTGGNGWTQAANGCLQSIGAGMQWVCSGGQASGGQGGSYNGQVYYYCNSGNSCAESTYCESNGGTQDQFGNPCSTNPSCAGLTCGPPAWFACQNSGAGSCAEDTTCEATGGAFDNHGNADCVQSDNTCGGGCPTLPQCGNANGIYTATPPTTNLCAIGTPSNGGGGTAGKPWTWQCNGYYGAGSVSCSAPSSLISDSLSPTVQPVYTGQGYTYDASITNNSTYLTLINITSTVSGLPAGGGFGVTGPAPYSVATVAPTITISNLGPGQSFNTQTCAAGGFCDWSTFNGYPLPIIYGNAVSMAGTYTITLSSLPEYASFYGISAAEATATLVVKSQTQSCSVAANDPIRFTGLQGSSPGKQSFTITNTGLQPFSFYFGPGGSWWPVISSVSPGYTIAPGGVATVTLDPGTIWQTPGIYKGYININPDPSVSCDVSKVNVELDVTNPSCAAGAVSVSPASITQGGTAAVSAPAGWSGGTFVSGNTTVATVSGATATGVSGGTADISGFDWTDSGGHQPCNLSAAVLRVVPSCPSGAVVLANNSIAVGGGTLASVPSGWACPSGNCFASSDNKVATVSSGGAVTGVSGGTTDISGAGWTYTPTGAFGCSLSPAPLTVNHYECVSNACKLVSGPGQNRCATDNDCGGGGSGGMMYAVCDPAQRACVNTSTPGTSCSSDASCGGSQPTHLACQNLSCVIEDGAALAPGEYSCSAPGYDINQCGVTVAINPQGATLGLSQGQQFRATVSNPDGSPASNQNVTWWVNGILGGNNSVGTITSGGYYVAPSTFSGLSSVAITAKPELPGQSATVPVIFNAPPVIVSFTANPSSIVPPELSTLSWVATGNITSCTIDNSVGAVASNGSAQVSPSRTTTYTLTCIGPDGTAAKTALVAVQSPGLYEISP
ncbi:MAG: hypothetical protein KGJ13_06570 [Patescibacteria group bacterium]|nr:hypothetical protein [Patescibacteria group bacterium]